MSHVSHQILTLRPPYPIETHYPPLTLYPSLLPPPLSPNLNRIEKVRHVRHARHHGRGRPAHTTPALRLGQTGSDETDNALGGIEAASVTGARRRMLAHLAVLPRKPILGRIRCLPPAVRLARALNATSTRSRPRRQACAASTEISVRVPHFITRGPSPLLSMS